MKAVPPLGQADGTDYTDLDIPNGIPGSPVPAAFFNMMNAEIENVITQAGLTPDEEDLTQLAEAIPLLVSSAGGLIDVQFVAASGTWNKPAEMTDNGFVRVTVIGGGGGGAGTGVSPSAAGIGGTTSFGSHVSAPGGQAGVSAVSSGDSAANLVAGGTGVGGDLNGTGEYGGAPMDIGSYGYGGKGGGSLFGGGGNMRGTQTNGYVGGNGVCPGAGGSGAATIQNGNCASGGAGGGWAIKKIDAADLGTTETIVIGAGGTAGGAGTSGGAAGGAGAAGLVIVESYR
jgi:hypothetical protein